MARILVTTELPPGGADPLAGLEVVDAGTDVDGIVCQLTDRYDAQTLSRYRTLRVLATVSVGFDHIDVEAATARGVAVCNTPGVLDETTADLAFGLIIAASRLFGTAEADLRQGRWTGFGLLDRLGRDVHDATLGLVGYGRIGRAVARRAEGFDMRVLHHARKVTGEPGFVADLDELLTAADVVSLHVPLTPETRRLIDRRRLALMKSTAVLVNTARGPVVDEEALADALEEGRLFAAGIDVYEREPFVHPRLLAAPRTVLLPHIGSATVATRTAMARLACEEVRAVLAGERPPNCLNPSVLG
ncbi:MAG TPA: D-glycerate dehydrogenase [Acidimicrobiales bacterium]|nr:D-glycerate dehydrogenase [Acidimicrobiales bacterium]